MSDDKGHESEDELDKFMRGIDDEIEKQKTEDTSSKPKGVRTDIENMDDHESYFKYIEETEVIQEEEEDEYEYDSDGNVVNTFKKRVILPLPPVDHSQISYKPFDKNFYREHSDVKRFTETEIDKVRKDFGIRVSGMNPVRPCLSFAHFCFDKSLIDLVISHGYNTPTPIQSQAISVALSGRDIIGIAKTGSGKTAAYLLPMMVHCISQPELSTGDGPIALVCAPTRELCQQIYLEAKKFAQAYNLTVAIAFGGANKHDQSRELQQGAEIVIATPGRLIDHLKDGSTNLIRVTYLVFDEADRMFELGFEPQVRSIANNVRPDRQCLLFSATFKKKLEKLCREILTDPIRIVIGEIGEANEDVNQIVEVFADPHEKWPWLIKNIVKFSSSGSVLIFVTKKENCEELGKNLKQHGHGVCVIHGDFDQYERNRVMSQFRKKEVPILVATDVAARGLDIPSIRTVINYDVARDITTHTHRIGRTGRAGEKGEAYTLVSPTDLNFLPDLVRNLEGANQNVSAALMELALKNDWFRKQREKHGAASVARTTQSRARPGLGFSNKSGPSDSSSNAHITVESAINRVKVQNKTGQDKLAALKSAFSKDYNRFKKASDNSSGSSFKRTQQPQSDAINNNSRQKKSKWS